MQRTLWCVRYKCSVCNQYVSSTSVADEDSNLYGNCEQHGTVQVYEE